MPPATDPIPGPGAGQGIPDADYAELIHAAAGGKMSPDSAMSLAVKRHQMAPADLAEHLYANGLVPDSALKYAQVGSGNSADTQFAQQKADFIAQHPTLDKAMAVGQGLARGVSYGGTENAEGPDEQAMAQRHPTLVGAGQFVGTLASPVTRLIGAAGRMFMPTAGAVTSGIAQGGASGALQGLAQPAPTLADRLKNAAVQGGVGAAAGGGTGLLAGRAQAPLVDQTVKAERDAAYQGMRAGAPVTDPGFLAKANEFYQGPEGQESFAAGQQKVYGNSGQRVPNLPEPTVADQKSLFAAQLAGKPAPAANSITSITPEQIDAWKQGAKETGNEGAFRPLLTQADQLVPGYQSARGLHEASLQPSPNLADLGPGALKAASIVGGAATHNPWVAIPGLALSSYLKAAARKPLSEAAQAALKGVQQQVGDLSLGQLFEQGGMLPAALTGLSRAAPYVAPLATGAAPGSSASPGPTGQ